MVSPTSTCAMNMPRVNKGPFLIFLHASWHIQYTANCSTVSPTLVSSLVALSNYSCAKCGQMQDSQPSKRDFLSRLHTNVLL